LKNTADPMEQSPKVVNGQERQDEHFRQISDKDERPEISNDVPVEWYAVPPSAHGKGDECDGGYAPEEDIGSELKRWFPALGEELPCLITIQVNEEHQCQKNEYAHGVKFKRF